MGTIAAPFLFGPVTQGDCPQASPSANGGNPMRWECRYLMPSCASLPVRFRGRVRIYEFISKGFYGVWLVGRKSSVAVKRSIL